MTTLDSMGTIDTHAAAMRVREALLMLLRAHCEMYGLPNPVPTVAERERSRQRGGRAEYGPIHHQRGTPSDGD